MNVLIACEESQVSCCAFRDKGHNAYSCDLIKCSGNHPEWHILGDALIACNPGSLVYLENGESFITPEWDLMIGHPPCTYLSRAGTSQLFKNGSINLERYKKGEDAAKFFNMLWNAPINKICLENPIPFTFFNLPKPSDLIQPYEFGEPYSKATYLWLKNLPPLFKTDILSWHKSYTDKYRSQKDRSITFPGIAKAFVDQWG